MLRKALITAVLSHLLLLQASAQPEKETREFVILSINDARITVELADNPAETSAGLMYRQSVPAGTGMLFDFVFPRKVCMWMKNTYVPLDAAFIGRGGVIVSIDAMSPHDTSRVCSPNRVRYVLEAPAGWLNEQGARVGSKVTGGPFGDL